MRRLLGLVLYAPRPSDLLGWMEGMASNVVPETEGGRSTVNRKRR